MERRLGDPEFTKAMEYVQSAASENTDTPKTAPARFLGLMDETGTCEAGPR